MNNMRRQAYGVWKPPPHTLLELQMLKNYFSLFCLFSLYQDSVFLISPPCYL
jgi:hypothetical protein